MSRARAVAQAGMIAAVYGGLTLVTVQFLGPLAWGPIQLRVSEAATVLAFFTPAAVPGLALGSVVANLYTLASTGTPVAMLDVVFGSLGTLLGAAWTWRFRSNVSLGLMGPVLANALIVPAYLPIVVKALGLPLYKVPILGINFEGRWLPMYLFGFVTIALGQSIVMFGLGLPLLVALRRLGLQERLGGRV